jgi:hypothetical protein
MDVTVKADTSMFIHLEVDNPTPKSVRKALEKKVLDKGTRIIPCKACQIDSLLYVLREGSFSLSEFEDAQGNDVDVNNAFWTLDLTAASDDEEEV